MKSHLARGVGCSLGKVSALLRGERNGSTEALGSRGFFGDGQAGADRVLHDFLRVRSREPVSSLRPDVDS